MMNEISEFNQNTRTLIVSFVVAVMAMIPLRFVEVGQMVSVGSSQPTVLGEMVENKVVLPNANVDQKLLEAPYDEIDGGNQVLGATTENVVTPTCYSRDEATLMYNNYDKVLKTLNLNDLQKQEIAEQILDVEKKVCR